ncbi:MAG TPA: aspartate--tRNA ligase [Candidatus Megaira endosymbiont of Hartmannula sinica]|nr:aspartate--tRNA ligase [Candidatus Megaera endosymbiont of Hartmannula sinica]
MLKQKENIQLSNIIKTRQTNKYRTNDCGSLGKDNNGEKVRLSGFVHRRRDHGNLLFIDLRDHYGITQLVFTDKNKSLQDKASYLKYESVITIEGIVVNREDSQINHDMKTGHIEIDVDSYILESSPLSQLPFVVNNDNLKIPEDMRLKYRFLDLRREIMHKHIILRSKVISFIRKIMTEKHDFIEFQTPILTASSPEGARDFLVPSRLNPGKFYALPQAPQQFKQMLMISGFDKYFQIAPCFRDEDARADRSPGEFYQLDIEASFVTREDIFSLLEDILYEIFTKFSNKTITSKKFVQIPYSESMLYYGTDKPDLRNPIKISDVTEIFASSDFTLFKNAIKDGGIVRAIPAIGAAKKPRRFFDEMLKYAISVGAKGLGYIILKDDEKNGAKGPVAKFLTEKEIESLKEITNSKDGDVIFFSCGEKNEAISLAGSVRTELGKKLELIDESKFEFCWIVDFPFYEKNEETGKIEFSHNPFSMPIGEIQTLEEAKTQEELLDIKAYQYDIVCNGIELSSGAIRNHKPEIMYKAFEIAGYSKEQVNKEFGGMIKALSFGAPPHGGIAPGIDRMIMLLANTENIREITAFPMNGNAEDLLMNAPNTASKEQLKELNIELSQYARTILKEEKQENNNI